MTQISISKDLEKLEKNVQHLKKALTYFNDEEWPNKINLIVDALESTLSSNKIGISEKIFFELNSFGLIIMQAEWPDIDNTDSSRDQRIDNLRGVLGNLKIDIDKILEQEKTVLNQNGLYFDFAAEQLRIDRQQHKNLVNGVQNRLLKLESALRENVSELTSDPLSTSAKIGQYLNRVLNSGIKIARATLTIGKNVDLGVLESSSLIMLDTARRASETAYSKKSTVSLSFKRAIKSVSDSVLNFAKGIRTVLKYVIFYKNEENRDNEYKTEHDDEFVQTAGNILRLARNKLGYSVSDISYQTRIAPRYVDAIETSNFFIFSSEMYIIGFAKTYAQIVKEEPLMIANLIKKEILKSQFRRNITTNYLEWKSNGPVIGHKVGPKHESAKGKIKK